MTLCAPKRSSAKRPPEIEPECSGRYTPYNTAAYGSIITVYPECYGALNIRAHSLLSTRVGPDTVPDICPVCLGAISVTNEILVAPHEGRHWTHFKCFVQWASTQINKDCPVICPLCRKDVSQQLLALASHIARGDTADVTALRNISCPVVITAPTVINPRNSLLAWAKDVIVILENLRHLRRCYSCYSEIGALNIDLSGITYDAGALIRALVYTTKKASVLEVYTARITPPAVNAAMLSRLYNICLDMIWLGAVDGVSARTYDMICIVLASLMFDRTRDSLQSATGILNISARQRREWTSAVTVLQVLHTEFSVQMAVCMQAGNQIVYKECMQSGVLVREFTSNMIAQDPDDLPGVVASARWCFLNGGITPLKSAMAEACDRAVLHARKATKAELAKLLAENNISPDEMRTATEAVMLVNQNICPSTVFYRPAVCARDFYPACTFAPGMVTIRINGCLLPIERMILIFAQRRLLTPFGFLLATASFKSGYKVLLQLTKNRLDISGREDLRNNYVTTCIELLFFICNRLAPSKEDMLAVKALVAGDEWLAPCWSSAKCNCKLCASESLGATEDHAKIDHLPLPLHAYT